MSTWDDFKKSVGYYADKTVKKTRELTDTASLKIKIASKEADRDTEYKRLGKLTYAKLKNTTSKDSEKLTRAISECIEKLDAILSELDSMLSEEEIRRAKKEAEKATKNEKKENFEKDESEPEVKSEKESGDDKTDN